MPITSWPVGTDVQAALAGLGVSAPGGLDLDHVADQATAKAHSLIGYPFIEQASGSDLYDAPYSNVLYLRSWYSAISAVAIGVDETNTTGTVLNIGTDCFFEKNRAGIIRAIKFPSAIFGSQESIKITGTAGYTDDIPGGLWNAVLDYAVAIAVNRARAFNGTLIRIKQGDTEKQWQEPSDTVAWMKAQERALESACAPYQVFSGVC